MSASPSRLVLNYASFRCMRSSSAFAFDFLLFTPPGSTAAKSCGTCCFRGICACRRERTCSAAAVPHQRASQCLDREACKQIARPRSGESEGSTARMGTAVQLVATVLLARCCGSCTVLYRHSVFLKSLQIACLRRGRPRSLRRAGQLENGSLTLSRVAGGDVKRGIEEIASIGHISTHHSLPGRRACKCPIALLQRTVSLVNLEGETALELPSWPVQEPLKVQARPSYLFSTFSARSIEAV